MNPKLTVLTGADFEQAPLVEATFANTSEYCCRHGFRFLCDIWPPDDEPASWKKLLLLHNALMWDGGWVLWVDADTVIIDHGASVYDEFIKPAEEQEHYMACCDGTHSLNCGVWALKNCSKSFRLLAMASDKTHCKNHPWWEQKAIVEVFEENSEMLSGVFFHELHPWNVQPANFCDGTRLVHVAGGPGDKLGLIKLFLKEVKK